MALLEHYVIGVLTVLFVIVGVLHSMRLLLELALCLACHIRDEYKAVNRALIRLACVLAAAFDKDE
jgi:hypothetical protein